MRKILPVALAIAAIFPSPFLKAATAEDFSFDIAEFEKKPYEIGGYLEPEVVLRVLDRDSALYRMKFRDDDHGKAIEEYGLTAQIEGEYSFSSAKLYVLGQGRAISDYEEGKIRLDLFEGYLSIQPGPAFSLDAGKQVLFWGKGYAWNPVSFIDRPKDPDEPELSREGFTAISVDFIRSFEGPLQTAALTPVIIPVCDWINDDFGETGSLNAAGKIYFLYRDTDIDLLFLTGKSRGESLGLDFSRNLTGNFEIHGELAYDFNEEKAGLDQEGNLTTGAINALSYLFGLRYLTSTDLTIIAEYYHNGPGYKRSELENYFELIHKWYDIYESAGDDTQLRRMSLITRNYFSGRNLTKNYLYLRAIQKEPFDLLYFNPALTIIMNLDDLSASITPEMVCSPSENLSLKFRTTVLAGGRLTEYGEKLSDYKLEFNFKYYF